MNSEPSPFGSHFCSGAPQFRQPQGAVRVARRCGEHISSDDIPEELNGAIEHIRGKHKIEPETFKSQFLEQAHWDVFRRWRDSR